MPELSQGGSRVGGRKRGGGEWRTAKKEPGKVFFGKTRFDGKKVVEVYIGGMAAE